MLSKVALIGHVYGLLTNLPLGEVISLQYADDTMLFLSHDIEEACHLKWLMVYFEQLSEMKINYNKSDMTTINLEEDETHQMAQIFFCKMGTFPFQYLGVLLHHEKSKRDDIQTVVDTAINRIQGWRGRLMSYSARLTLLKACMAIIPIYLMHVIRFPKWTIEAINSHMTIFSGMT
jgi:hypothetical protein